MDTDRLLRIARQHVQTDRLLGVDAVPQGAAVAQVVAEALSRPATAARTIESAPQLPAAAPDAPAHSGPPVAAAGADLFGAPPPRTAARAQGGQSTMSRDEKIAALRVMDESEVRRCTKCELCHSRTQTVFGEGDADASLLFIGEGPGQTEDELGRPFVGRAGELLDKMIVAMGLQREQVFIANVVKCRPPNNRTPTPAETDACWDYLRRQIEIIRPRAIVTLGGPATKMLLKTKDGITRLRGTWHTYDGLTPHGPPIPLMPTFHPAYLLRSYTPDNRKKVWSDLQKVMAELAT